MSYTVVAGVPATPTVSLAYGLDSSCTSAHGAGCIGQIISMTDGPGSENYTYNSLEQLTQLQKVIGGTPYSTSYLYNLAGQVAQNPFNPTITYDKNFSAKDLAAAQSKVGGAVGLINSKWSKLSDQEKATLQGIKSIDVSGTAARSYVQESTGKLTLTQDYVSKSSTAWLASAVGHDSEHVALYNSGGIGASRGIPAEVKAMQFQLQVGTTFALRANIA